MNIAIISTGLRQITGPKTLLCLAAILSMLNSITTNAKGMEFRPRTTRHRPYPRGEKREERMTISAYCNEGKNGCAICCGKWSANNRTASGAKSRQGITVAASRSIPLGTRIYIESVGWRTVEDRLARRFDARCDVYFNRHSDARNFGIKRLKVTIPERTK